MARPRLGRAFPLLLFVAVIYSSRLGNVSIEQQQELGSGNLLGTVEEKKDESVSVTQMSTTNYKQNPRNRRKSNSKRTTNLMAKPNKIPSYRYLNITKKIAFVHFHKAGGTSLVELFTNHFQSWNPSSNGNPWAVNDQNQRYLVHFWKYDPHQMEAFLSKQPFVQFLATEWNFFTSLNKDEVLRKFDLITCIRDPYSRFVSNLFANHYQPIYQDQPQLWIDQNFTWALKKKNALPWNDFPVNYNKPNYYVAFLNGLADREYDWKGLNATHHLQVAKERLHWFKGLLILDQPETHSVMEQWLPAKELPEYNVNKQHGKDKSIAMTREEFNQLNQLDVELYEYAVELAISRVPK